MSEERYWSQEDLSQELLRRGCVETGHKIGRGTLWFNNDGESFSVPPAPESRGYPPRLIRDILFFADPRRARILN